MATAYPNLRQHLDSDYARLPDRHIEALMQTQGMDAESMEGFFDDLKKVATSVGQVALKAAPSVIGVAAPLIGTAFGGPIGGMIGSSLGSLAGGAIASATGQRPPAGGGSPGGGIGQILGGLVGGGSPAAGSLLQNLLKPQTIQALGTMALGGLGKDTVPVGGQSVPIGGFLNMLKTFLGNAEAEYNAAQAAADAALPEYLRDYSGLPSGDPANDRLRAQRLQELLESAESAESAEAAEAAEGAELSEAESEAMEAEYELEMLEAEMEGQETEEV